MTKDDCDRRWKRLFVRRLLSWFRRHARDLPWRQTRDPYAIWVSEIMLQQTQVATVVPYFVRFMAALPSVQSLAAAPRQTVLRLWEGLGYYRRATQMHQAAKILVTRFGGRFPRDASVVRSLPGIGRYTAGAILSIAYDAREPILEANTVRLLSRLLAYRGDPRSSEGQRRLWSVAAELLTARRAGTFNQALMELGSVVCRPRDPACERCPVASLCPTREKGWQSVVPAKSARPQYEDVREAAVLIWRGDRVLVRQCRDGERWAGLWDFPRFAVRAGRGEALRREVAEQVTARTGVDIRLGPRLTTLHYGVTRFRITLFCFEAAFVQGRARRFRWLRPGEIADLPLSVTGRRLGKLVEARRGD